jgi:hypothetical protein
VPEAPLARVSLHGEGQPVNAGSLESIARVFCAAIATGIAEAAVFCTDQAVAIAGAFHTPRLQTLQRDCHAPGALDFPLTQERLALALQG